MGAGGVRRLHVSLFPSPLPPSRRGGGLVNYPAGREGATPCRARHPPAGRPATGTAALPCRPRPAGLERNQCKYRQQARQRCRAAPPPDFPCSKRGPRTVAKPSALPLRGPAGSLSLFSTSTRRAPYGRRPANRSAARRQRARGHKAPHSCIPRVRRRGALRGLYWAFRTSKS